MTPDPLAALLVEITTLRDVLDRLLTLVEQHHDRLERLERHVFDPEPRPTPTTWVQ